MIEIVKDIDVNKWRSILNIYSDEPLLISWVGIEASALKKHRHRLSVDTINNLMIWTVGDGYCKLFITQRFSGNWTYFLFKDQTCQNVPPSPRASGMSLFYNLHLSLSIFSAPNRFAQVYWNPQ
jgi:hypothetical protein